MRNATIDIAAREQWISGRESPENALCVFAARYRLKRLEIAAEQHRLYEHASDEEEHQQEPPNDKTSDWSQPLKTVKYVLLNGLLGLRTKGFDLLLTAAKSFSKPHFDEFEAHTVLLLLGDYFLMMMPSRSDSVNIRAVTIVI